MYTWLCYRVYLLFRDPVPLSAIFWLWKRHLQSEDLRTLAFFATARKSLQSCEIVRPCPPHHHIRDTVPLIIPRDEDSKQTAIHVFWKACVYCSALGALFWDSVYCSALGALFWDSVYCSALGALFWDRVFYSHDISTVIILKIILSCL